MSQRKVTLREKYEEYDMNIVALRSRRTDQVDFPSAVGQTTGRYPEHLYLEADLDYWFYKVYSPKRKKRKQQGSKTVRVAKSVREMSFDDMAVLFVTGNFHALAGSAAAV